MMKMTILVTVLAGVMIAAPAIGAEQSAEDLAKEKEAVKKATEELQQELRKNKDVVDKVVREMLQETAKNKEGLKELFRELGRNREELQKTIKELVNDPELRKNLNELSDIIRESGREFVKPTPGKQAQ